MEVRIVYYEQENGMPNAVNIDMSKNNLIINLQTDDGAKDTIFLNDEDEIGKGIEQIKNITDGNLRRWEGLENLKIRPQQRGFRNFLNIFKLKFLSKHVSFSLTSKMLNALSFDTIEKHKKNEVPVFEAIDKGLEYAECRYKNNTELEKEIKNTRKSVESLLSYLKSISE
jgi:hypothetical protein